MKKPRFGSVLKLVAPCGGFVGAIFAAGMTGDLTQRRYCESCGRWVW
jgi:hypothetical protein